MLFSRERKIICEVLCCARSTVEQTKTTWFIRAADFSWSGWHLISDWSQGGGSRFFNLIRWRTCSPRPPSVRDVNLCYLTSDPFVASILSAWGAVEMEKTVNVCRFDLQTASFCMAFTHPHYEMTNGHLKTKGHQSFAHQHHVVPLDCMSCRPVPKIAQVCNFYPTLLVIVSHCLEDPESLQRSVSLIIT